MTFKPKMVLKGETSGKECGNVSNPVLSGKVPDNEGMYNRFFNTQSEFQSYNGADMTYYGYLLIDVKDKVTKKYHPIKFYVMNTDVPRILISHAASYWLGLVKV